MLYSYTHGNSERQRADVWTRAIVINGKVSL